MHFSWDATKARDNLLRHGIDFADAATSLDDPHAVTIVDPDAIGEARFVAIAMDANRRILVTVYTYRADTIRLISSRKASAGERRRYAWRVRE
jgi:uncharacterized DUF497 family protein